MSMIIRRKPGGFLKDQGGSLSVEAAIILPILFWAICAMYTYFNVFKVQSAAYRANYTISDILSRETQQVDVAYIRSLHNVYQYMTFAQTPNTWIRISSFSCTNKCEEPDRMLKIDWSEATNGGIGYEAADLSIVEELLPSIPKGDTLVMVETSSLYSPIFQKMVPNFGDRDIVTRSVTRPRFIQQLVWAGPSDDGSGTPIDTSGDEPDADPSSKDKQGHPKNNT